MRALVFVTLGRLGSALVIAMLAATNAGAQSPDTLVYEGFLEEGGAPVTGERTVAFALFGASSGGVATWTETHADLPIAGGFFSVVLGTLDASLPVAVETDHFLEVTVGALTLGRQEIGAVPFALHAGQVDWADIQNKPAGFADDLDNESAAGGPDIGLTAFGSVYLHEEGNQCPFQGPRSANVTATTYVDAAGACDITITGVNFSLNDHLAVVSGVGSGTNPANAFWTSTGGKLRLFVKTTNNAVFPAGTIVTFMVIAP